jgi:hypothetical protein
LYTKGSPYLELPSLSEYEQSLVSKWFECGTCEQGSGGLMPLSWGEIVSWATYFYKETIVEMVEHPRHSKRHKRTYTPLVIERSRLVDWELEQIKRLSQEYVSEYSQGSAPDRQCPTTIFVDDVSEDDKVANAKSIREAMRVMFGKQ